MSTQHGRLCSKQVMRRTLSLRLDFRLSLREPPYPTPPRPILHPPNPPTPALAHCRPPPPGLCGPGHLGHPGQLGPVLAGGCPPSQPQREPCRPAALRHQPAGQLDTWPPPVMDRAAACPPCRRFVPWMACATRAPRPPTPQATTSRLCCRLVPAGRTGGGGKGGGVSVAGTHAPLLRALASQAASEAMVATQGWLLPWLLTAACGWPKLGLRLCRGCAPSRSLLALQAARMPPPTFLALQNQLSITSIQLTMGENTTGAFIFVGDSSDNNGMSNPVCAKVSQAGGETRRPRSHNWACLRRARTVGPLPHPLPFHPPPRRRTSTCRPTRRCLWSALAWAHT